MGHLRRQEAPGNRVVSFYGRGNFIGEMPAWMDHKLESRLQGEISINSGMQMTPEMAESEEELKNLLMKVKEKSEKAGLKLNI